MSILNKTTTHVGDDPIATNPSRDRAAAAALLMAAVFAACLFGIATRPVGFLANIWPANAIMLALLLRMPMAGRSPAAWMGAAIAFMAADLLTGTGFSKALMLNGTNLIGVAAAFAVYAHMPADMVRLRQPASMLYLVLAVAIGAGAAGFAGAIINPILFGGTTRSGWTFWFATEFVNYVTLLPVLLAAPSLRSLARGETGLWKKVKPANLLPILALAASCALATTVGGPGAMAIPVPALLWCGLAYPLFATAILTLSFGLWTLTVATGGYLADIGDAHDETLLVSVRLGTSLVALAPLMVASIVQSRNELLAQLRHLASHDELTGIRNRSAFMSAAQRLHETGSTPVAIMMLDLDHFKRINDGHGHAVGDTVLQVFAERVAKCLRKDDLFARMGGEEFAIFAPACPPEEAQRVAKLITGAVHGEAVALDDGSAIAMTVSIGIVSMVKPAPNLTLDAMLARADAALYRAKDKGRDRWEMA